MMRFACLTILLLAACSKDADLGDALVGVYRSQDRDALCVAGEGEALRAGLIAYGTGAANCSLAGRAEARGDVLVITPRGDSECSVEIGFANGVATVGARSPACAYYCGPGADYTGRVLRKTPDSTPKVADFAGDSLC
jgi:hypothetical protein